MLRGGPTDKPGKRMPVSPTCELKATHQELKSDIHWWNWLCFQQAYIKASNSAFTITVQARYIHTAYWHWSPAVSIKGMIMGRRGEGSQRLRRHYTRHTVRIQQEYRPHFVLTICPNRHQKACRCLLASLTEADYSWLLSHLVSAETRKPYSTRWYVSAVNEYSPIYDIRLSL